MAGKATGIRSQTPFSRLCPHDEGNEKENLKTNHIYFSESFKKQFSLSLRHCNEDLAVWLMLPNVY